MKVLTINCVFGKGSTGKIITDIENALCADCSFVHCYESGPKSGEVNYRIAGWLEFRFYYLLARLTGVKYSTGFTSTFRLISYIKKQTPDIVHIHCPNCGTVNLPWLISFLKKNGIPTVITNHAEFFYTGNCPHAFECMKFTTGCGDCSYVFDPYRKFLFDRTAYEWKRMKRAFENLDRAISVSVSPWVMSRQQLSPIMNHMKSVVVKNGIDTENVFFPRETDLKARLNIPEDKRIILHVTASFSDRKDDPKGGYYILELAKKMPDAVFLIVGSSLVSDLTNIGSNVMIQGHVKDQSVLAEYYSIADVTVMTSRRETYGMTCAESLCCGTPVVGFKAGGPESIALEDHGAFVEFGDIDALYHALNKWINKKNAVTERISQKAACTYSSKTMAKEYLQVYKDVLNI